MKKILMVTSLSLTLAALSFTGAQAKSCKSKKVYETGGAALTWTGARVRAKTEWRIDVTAKYGVKYASWVLAKNKGLNCWKVGVSKVCKASAKPCRL
ncbi:MAG: hypothetical protein ACRBBN_21695 [Methyloligellaceae bacterium]